MPRVAQHRALLDALGRFRPKCEPRVTQQFGRNGVLRALFLNPVHKCRAGREHGGDYDETNHRGTRRDPERRA